MRRWLTAVAVVWLGVAAASGCAPRPAPSVVQPAAIGQPPAAESLAPDDLASVGQGGRVPDSVAERVPPPAEMPPLPVEEEPPIVEVVRSFRAEDVKVPPGYRVDVAAAGLTFPTALAFDGEGHAFVLEAGYTFGDQWMPPSLSRVEADGRLTKVVSGGDNGPWTGVDYRDGLFYITEGGTRYGGRILRVGPGAQVTTLLDNLAVGDHHVSSPLIGPDGWLYFAQGSVTNSGVVGPDNAQVGWLRHFSRMHDIACHDVTLTGRNFTAEGVTTGAFAPYGTPSAKRQVVAGAVPCTGAIMRMPPQGGQPQLVAWGFRNPYGIAFAADGTLYSVDSGYEPRGSRPVANAADHLWRVSPGVWYGWPDFSGATPVTDRRFRVAGQPPLAFLMANHPNPPPRPVAALGVHAATNGIDFARPGGFGAGGQAFVAQFGGDDRGAVGYKVVQVDPASGAVRDFARNPVPGPASAHGGGGLEHPIALRFAPDGQSLYVVDFGVVAQGAGGGVVPMVKTGVLWRISAVGG